MTEPFGEDAGTTNPGIDRGLREAVLKGLFIALHDLYAIENKPAWFSPIGCATVAAHAAAALRLATKALGVTDPIHEPTYNNLANFEDWTGPKYKHLSGEGWYAKPTAILKYGYKTPAPQPDANDAA